jgi:hypothetical protein
VTQSFDLERELTPDEIRERTELREQLDDERDTLLAAVEDRRREIRGFNVSRKKLESRLRDVRRELRTGKMFESPQGTLALDLSVPDPFGARYPQARDAEQLHRELAVVLQGVLVPSIERLAKWHPSSAIFQSIAHWARTELAHMNAKEHPTLVLPSRLPMPEKLAELRMYLGRKSQPRPRAVTVRPPTGKVGRRAKGAEGSVKRSRANGRKAL